VRAPGGCVGSRITPGALGCRSGSPPIPAETGPKYSKRSPLTVLLRPQVQTIRFVCQILELSAWVIVLTIAVLPIILGAIALWDAFRWAGVAPLGVFLPAKPMRSYSTDG